MSKWLIRVRIDRLDPFDSSHQRNRDPSHHRTIAIPDGFKVDVDSWWGVVSTANVDTRTKGMQLMDKKLSIPDKLQHLIEKRDNETDRRLGEERRSDGQATAEEPQKDQRAGSDRRQEDRRDS